MIFNLEALLNSYSNSAYPTNKSGWRTVSRWLVSQKALVDRQHSNPKIFTT
ncbi:hypothetical protein [Maribellus mangrovi]|uniref:hypothetical protein n=1 Tax=Maribellus mangrovi TaxID=3133146 RepID=UPI0030EDB670